MSALIVPAELPRMVADLLPDVSADRDILLFQDQIGVSGAELDLTLITEELTGVETGEQIIESGGGASFGVSRPGERGLATILNVNAEQEGIALIAEGGCVVKTEHEAASIQVIAR